jgi:hypothetical protein
MLGQETPGKAPHGAPARSAPKADDAAPNAVASPRDQIHRPGIALDEKEDETRFLMNYHARVDSMTLKIEHETKRRGNKHYPQIGAVTTLGISDHNGATQG